METPAFEEWAALRGRVLGPYRGYFIAVGALLMGEFGHVYRGWGKVFERLPQSTLSEGEILTVQSESEFRRVEDALDDAEDLLVQAVDALPERTAAPERAPLESLAYVSRAVGFLDADKLARLLRRARERNLQQGVTGMLLYSDETFIQYIEGPANHLQLVYRTIRKDPMHNGVIKFLEQPIAERVFPDWSMAFEMPGSQLWLPGEVRRPQLVRGVSQSVVHALLAAFLDRRSVR